MYSFILFNDSDFYFTIFIFALYFTNGIYNVWNGGVSKYFYTCFHYIIYNMSRH